MDKSAALVSIPSKGVTNIIRMSLANGDALTHIEGNNPLEDESIVCDVAEMAVLEEDALGWLIICNLNMIKHDYSCNLRHKTLHLCAYYHTLSAFLSFYAYLCHNLKIH